MKILRPLTALLCLILMVSPAFADEKAQLEMLDRVAARLLAEVEDPPSAWPPRFQLIPAEEMNAGVLRGDDGRPLILVTTGLMDRVVGDNEAHLAFVLGHEFGHVLLGHLEDHWTRQQADALKVVHERQHELDSDLFGTKLALKAGYSKYASLGAMRSFVDQGQERSSFEGLSSDHPSWKERLAALDARNKSLWQSMSVFENGVYFLMAEQYKPAAGCFEVVLDDFPECYEAWTNLGFAKLMQYCDGLKAEELQELGVGQLVCGGFFQTAESIRATTRGDNDVWSEAVEALETALELKPDSAEIKGNLGLAYLVSPNPSDRPEGAKMLAAAAGQLLEQEKVDPVILATVLVNAGAGMAAYGDPKVAADIFDKLEKALEETGLGQALAMSEAVLYNRALLQSKAKKEQAYELFDTYLQTGRQKSAWWSLAYDNYERLGKELGRPVKGDEEFTSGQALHRQVTGLALRERRIDLADHKKVVVERFGEPAARSQLSDLVERWLYPEQKLEVLVGLDLVVGLRLQQPGGPKVSLRGKGLGSDTELLGIGDAQSKVESVLGATEFESRRMFEREGQFRFYRQLGLALRFHEGQLKEMFVVEVGSR